MPNTITSGIVGLFSIRSDRISNICEMVNAMPWNIWFQIQIPVAEYYIKCCNNIRLHNARARKQFTLLYVIVLNSIEFHTKLHNKYCVKSRRAIHTKEYGIQRGCNNAILLKCLMFTPSTQQP